MHTPLMQISIALVLHIAPGPLVTVDSARATAPKVDSTKPWVGIVDKTTTHRKWLVELAKCQGLKAYEERLPWVQMYYTNTRSIFNHYLAWTIPEYGQVYFVFKRKNNPALVKHELLHLLLYWNGIPDPPDNHDQKRFTTCGVELDFDPI